MDVGGELVGLAFVGLGIDWECVDLKGLVKIVLAAQCVSSILISKKLG